MTVQSTAFWRGKEKKGKEGERGGKVGRSQRSSNLYVLRILIPSEKEGKRKGGKKKGKGRIKVYRIGN